MRDALRRLGPALRRMLGLPDYAAYCAHLARRHPDAVPLDRGAFLKLCQERRFGGRGPTRCC